MSRAKGSILSDKHRLHLSIAAKNRKPISEETRLHLSESHKGKNNTNKGRKNWYHHSDKIRMEA